MGHSKNFNKDITCFLAKQNSLAQSESVIEKSTAQFYI